MRAAVKLKRFARFPSAVKNAHVDMRVLDVLTRFARVPGQHVASRAYGPLCIEYRKQRLCIVEMNGLFQVFGDGAHVQCAYDPAAQRVLIEKGRLDPQLVAFNVLFDDSLQRTDGFALVALGAGLGAAKEGRMALVYVQATPDRALRF